MATTVCHVDRTASMLMLGIQMAISVIGIYVCFTIWSAKQERVVTRPYSASTSARDGSSTVGQKGGEVLKTVFCLGLTQSFFSLTMGLLYLAGEDMWRRLRFFVSPSQSLPRKGIPPFSWVDVRQIMVVGFTSAFGTSFGFAAMRRLPYPVVLAAKMSKMLPIMIVGFLWYGTRYPWKKCMSCALITGCTLLFYLLEEDAKSSSTHDSAGETSVRGRNRASGHIGLFLLFVGLTMDGFTNSTQDVLVKRRGWSGNKLMVWTNMASFLWLLAVVCSLEAPQPLMAGFIDYAYTLLSAVPSGHHLLAILPEARYWTSDAIAFSDLSYFVGFLQQHPAALYDVVQMALMGALGQFFVFRTISLFGSLALMAMTMLRKSSSVVVSIVIHQHYVTPAQWLTLLGVFCGAIWEGWINLSEASARQCGASNGSARGTATRRKEHGISVCTSTSPSKRRSFASPCKDERQSHIHPNAEQKKSKKMRR